MPLSATKAPAYQFCTVEYLIVAFSRATNSTTAACNWLSRAEEIAGALNTLADRRLARS